MSTDFCFSASLVHFEWSKLGNKLDKTPNISVSLETVNWVVFRSFFLTLSIHFGWLFWRLLPTPMLMRHFHLIFCVIFDGIWHKRCITNKISLSGYFVNDENNGTFDIKLSCCVLCDRREREKNAILTSTYPFIMLSYTVLSLFQTLEHFLVYKIAFRPSNDGNHCKLWAINKFLCNGRFFCCIRRLFGKMKTSMKAYALAQSACVRVFTVYIHTKHALLVSTFLAIELKSCCINLYKSPLNRRIRQKAKSILKGDIWPVLLHYHLVVQLFIFRFSVSTHQPVVFVCWKAFASSWRN